MSSKMSLDRLDIRNRAEKITQMSCTNLKIIPFSNFLYNP